MIKDSVIEAATNQWGSKTAVGRRLGVRPQGFVNWKQVPPRHVVVLEYIAGISRTKIRLGVFDPPAGK